MQIPRLETDRTILDAHGVDDLENNHALWSNPEVVRYISGRPFTRQECWSRILRYAGHWALLGYGYWAVREKSSGRYIGDVGLQDAKRGIGPAFDTFPEAGWVIDPAFHCKGYGFEALSAALHWADRFLPSPETVCMVAPENLGSSRLAEKLGYTRSGVATYLEEPVLLFRRQLPEPR